ncbi:2-oxoacid:ferredoxin oxidoreductase subunit beta [Candidatus Woesearchaeota archaeon]|jgi:2-oxoglutarate/2-oxoacid ferredoxin oxidoreductase subunit beta|nr:2-oxoacid:ferredoxin oxidoreductase subunit beta [Candidatus Woesearchaeota archaeon]MBT7237551.1 2-oxoacid:ferredoxin oxidoreductase subunit beta [Candidatus Woesearchaeota archaeon]
MKIETKCENTWCPGCYNFMILNSIKKTIKKFNQKDFAMVTGIGCHAKIFDYLNLSGFYGLHGRVLPTMLGIKLGNPKLNVIGFAGDGDTYSEGLSHFISAGRYNSNITLFVHDNQSFSLTTGQVTPTSQQGFKSKAEPLGNINKPLDPLKLALASGATFVARCNSKDINHTAKIMEQAIKHEGFSFVEIIQTCVIFNKEMDNLTKYTYKVNNKTNMKKALQLANKWDYNSAKGKIPVGIIYKEKRKTLEST